MLWIFLLYFTLYFTLMVCQYKELVVLTGKPKKGNNFPN